MFTTHFKFHFCFMTIMAICLLSYIAVAASNACFRNVAIYTGIIFSDFVIHVFYGVRW